MENRGLVGTCFLEMMRSRQTNMKVYKMIRPKLRQIVSLLRLLTSQRSITITALEIFTEFSSSVRCGIQLPTGKGVIDFFFSSVPLQSS
jgi:hypothetical protein